MANLEETTPQTILKTMVRFNFQDLSKSSGVYVIFNNHNWRIYVGSTKEFKHRWADGHIGSLVGNKHKNRFLQSDFNKCKEILGHDNFLEFHILENMPGSTREERLSIEEKWLKVHFDRGKNCYNLTDRAISREGCGSKDPEETRRKHQEASRKIWQNSLYRQNQSKIQTVKTKEQWLDPKDRAQRITSMKRAWKKNPKLRENASKRMTGKLLSQETKDKISITVSANNIKLWQCEDYRNKVLEGRKRSWAKDIARKQAAAELIRKISSKTYILCSPDGTVETIINLQEFCRNHKDNLLPGELSKVARGLRQNYKGWRLPPKPNLPDNM